MSTPDFKLLDWKSLLTMMVFLLLFILINNGKKTCDLKMIGSLKRTAGEESGRLLEKARSALKGGKSEQALEYTKECLRHESSQEQAAELNRIAAEALLRQGKPLKARTYAESALSHGRASGNYRSAYDCAVTLGKVFARMNQYAAADHMWSEALTLAGLNKDRRLQALALLDLAMLDQRRGNHKRALNSLEGVRKSLQRTKTLRPLAVCYSRIAYSLLEEGKSEQAYHNLTELEMLAAQMKDDSLKASAHYRRASIYLKENRFKLALPEMKKVAETYKKIGDLKNLVLVLCDLARVYMNVGNSTKCDSVLEQVGVLIGELESTDVSAKLDITLAEKYSLDGSWAEAKKHYLGGLTKVEQTLNEDRLATLHESLQKTLKKLGFKLAGLEDLLLRARKCYLKAGLSREAEETERWLAEIPLTNQS